MVDVRREGDDTAPPGVVAGTMKLLGNFSYGYQIMGRSRHTITNYLNDEKTHQAINEPLFKKLNTLERVLYEAELLETTVEQQKLIICWIFQTSVCKTEKVCDMTSFMM